MPEEQKTVFISYRWLPAWSLARLVHDDLIKHGYDVFLDVKNTTSGKLEDIFLRQIEARAHFLVILTSGTLEDCSNPNDWMRREIEHAIDTQRNIVPLLGYGFSFKGTEKYLAGKLEQLRLYSGWPLNPPSFDSEMEIIRSRFLRQPFSGKIISISSDDLLAVEQIKVKAVSEPPPTKSELKAEEYNSLSLQKENEGDITGAIADYAEAIRLSTRVSNVDEDSNSPKNLMDYAKEVETSLYEILYSSIRQTSLLNALGSHFESYTNLVMLATKPLNQDLFQRATEILNQGLDKYAMELEKEFPNLEKNWEITKNSAIAMLTISQIRTTQDREALELFRSQFRDASNQMDTMLSSLKTYRDSLGKLNDRDPNLHPSIPKVQSVMDEQHEIYIIGNAYLKRIINLTERKLSEVQ